MRKKEKPSPGPITKKRKRKPSMSSVLQKEKKISFKLYDKHDKTSADFSVSFMKHSNILKKQP